MSLLRPSRKRTYADARSLNIDIIHKSKRSVPPQYWTQDREIERTMGFDMDPRGVWRIPSQSELGPHSSQEEMEDVVKPTIQFQLFCSFGARAFVSQHFALQTEVGSVWGYKRPADWLLFDELEDKDRVIPLRKMIHQGALIKIRKNHPTLAGKIGVVILSEWGTRVRRILTVAFPTHVEHLVNIKDVKFPVSNIPFPAPNEVYFLSGLDAIGITFTSRSIHYALKCAALYTYRYRVAVGSTLKILKDCKQAKGFFHTENGLVATDIWGRNVLYPWDFKIVNNVHQQKLIPYSDNFLKPLFNQARKIMASNTIKEATGFQHFTLINIEFNWTLGHVQGSRSVVGCRGITYPGRIILLNSSSVLLPKIYNTNREQNSWISTFFHECAHAARPLEIHNGGHTERWKECARALGISGIDKYVMCKDEFVPSILYVCECSIIPQNHHSTDSCPNVSCKETTPRIMYNIWNLDFSIKNKPKLRKDVEARFFSPKRIVSWGNTLKQFCKKRIRTELLNKNPFEFDL